VISHVHVREKTSYSYRVPDSIGLRAGYSKVVVATEGKSRFSIDSGSSFMEKSSAIQRWPMWGTKAHSAIDETVCAEVDKRSLLFVKSLPPRVIQFVKFCLVGGTGALVDMTVLFLLADPKTLALNITLSKVLAAEVAMLNNFAWNEIWTFRQTSGARAYHEGWFHRLLKFNAICGCGIGLAVLFLNLFHTWLGWNLYASNFTAVMLVTLWNFGMNAGLNWSTERRSK
jgi:putative flippase GtrA